MTTATKTTTTHRLTTGRLIAMGIGLAVLITMLLRIAQGFLADPINMLTGLLFGILAGVPATLLVFATSSRSRELERDEDERYERYHNAKERPLPAYPYQPPVVVTQPTWTPPSEEEQAQLARAAARTIAERLIAGDRDSEALDRIALDNHLIWPADRILWLREDGVSEDVIQEWMGEQEYAAGMRDMAGKGGAYWTIRI